jgi:signal transduction histidine kinase/ActR/RegA family two-component response regulator
MFEALAGPGRLTQKLTRVVVGVTLLALAFVTIAIVAYQAGSVARRERRDITRTTRVVAEIVRPALASADSAAAGRALRTLLDATEGVRTVRVYDAQGKSFALVGEREMRHAPVNRAVVDLDSAVRIEDLDPAYLHARQVVLDGDHAVGSVVVIAPRRSVLGVLGTWSLGIVALAAVLALVGFGLIAALRRAVTEPVLALAGAASVIASGEAPRAVRVRRYADDEVGELTDAFNRMLDTLDEREAALKASDDRLRFAINSAQMMEWYYDGGADLLRLEGALAGRLARRPGGSPRTLGEFLDLVVEDEREMVEASLGFALQQGGALVLEFRALGEQGILTLILRGQATVAHGAEPARIGGIVQDVTERRLAQQDQRRMQEHLQHSQRLDALGTLAGGVAHDFNNLITAMVGNLELLPAAVGDDLNALVAIEEARVAGERAAALTRQLLLFSRRGSALATRRPLDVGDAISRVVQMLRRLVPENVQLVWRRPSGTLWANADAAQLDQVVMNLVLNARDAMPEGGRVTVTIRPFETDAAWVAVHVGSRVGRFVMVSVHDEGTGIDPETRRHIFEPFFSTKASDQGTGLGLAVVFGIVQAHEGFIELTTEPGRGSTFDVFLPVARAPEGALDEPALPDAAPARHPGQRVLVADDQEGIRSLTKRALERLGYTAVVAEDGQAASEIFAQDPDAFDAVLLDIMMPRMGGPEALERMRAVRPALPAVFMTGYSGDAAMGDLTSMSRATVLQKPFVIRDLAVAIENALAGSGAAP